MMTSFAKLGQEVFNVTEVRFIFKDKNQEQNEADNKNQIYRGYLPDVHDGSLLNWDRRLEQA